MSKSLTAFAFAAAFAALAGPCGRADPHHDQVHAWLEDPGQRRGVLRRARQGLFPARGPERRHRPGRRLGCDGHAHHGRSLRGRLRRHQRDHPERRSQPGPAADHGLPDVEPAALRGRGAQSGGHQDHQGFRGQDAGRCPGHADHAADAGLRVGQQAGSFQDQVHEHGAQPAGAAADPGPHGRRDGLQHHELLQPDRPRPGSGQGLYVVLSSRITAWTSTRTA